jgi:hypothetical protein
LKEDEEEQKDREARMRGVARVCLGGTTRIRVQGCLPEGLG